MLFFLLADNIFVYYVPVLLVVNLIYVLSFFFICHIRTMLRWLFIYCKQELEDVGGKNSDVKVGRKASKKQKGALSNVSAARGKSRQGMPGSPGQNVQTNKAKAPKPQKVEPLVKEEGEMSDNEEVYEQFKEVKWREWCEDVMADDEKTLKRLQRLQSTSADLPKEKVH